MEERVRFSEASLDAPSFSWSRPILGACGAAIFILILVFAARWFTDANNVSSVLPPPVPAASAVPVSHIVVVPPAPSQIYRAPQAPEAQPVAGGPAAASQ